ncbi:unnamed protein product [Urochloa decumbens]|uniref:Gnk2-homologous domain-containing protein n=1 Tax=Urochloa decumbens TaxID=240449 RepID=A0ABC9H6Q2_9POAL
MTNLSPFSLVVFLLLLAVLPLPPAAAVAMRVFNARSSSSHVECVGDGIYTANSTYEANRRRLAGLLLAEAAARRGPYYTEHAAGYWPFRAQAAFLCRRPRHVNGTSSGDSSCAACIAGAFLEMERACPYHRGTFFYGRNCTLHLDEYRIFGTAVMYQGNILKQVLASGLIFQAIGFGWLFFLLLQEWRSRKRGTMMHSTPLLSGD